MRLQLILHLIALWPYHPAYEQYGVCLLVLHQEDERMVGVEQFGVFQFVRAKEAQVHLVAVGVPFHGRGVEHTGQVEILLPRDFGQVSFGFVHGLRQAQLPEVFLNRSRCLDCVK